VESLARAVVFILALFFLLGMIGLVLSLRARRHGRGAARAGLVLSVAQLTVGLTALSSLRPIVLAALLLPGLTGSFLAVRLLLPRRR
jgi:hypothetical protein